MTAPGWYPDQNGGSGKKYWDGNAWHDVVPVTPVEAAPPALGASPARLTTPKSSRLPSMPVILLVGIPLIILCAWFGNKVASGMDGTRRASAPAVGTVEQRRQTTFNYPLTITGPQFRMDGSSSIGTAFVQVSGPASVPAQSYFPARGAYYASQVTVASESGTVTVNPLFFAARTGNGTNLQSTVLIELDGLPATELPQGQKVTGWLVFDVPPGQRITEIILSDPLGAQLGRWTVPQ